MAVHLGVTPATASVLVDRLVRGGLLHRDSHPDERRRIRLSLTREGSQHLRTARTGTRRRLAEILGALPATDRAAISAGVSLLRHAFGSRNGVDGADDSLATRASSHAPARGTRGRRVRAGPDKNGDRRRTVRHN